MVLTYATIGEEIGQLCDEKNRHYGNSHGKSGDILRILYPDGISGEQMDDALTIVRVIDKLFRIATAKEAFGENPWKDIAGYAILKSAPDEAKSRTVDFYRTNQTRG